ncbi:MAG TPA: glycosyl hydrolase family 79 C-terminal domain-containing protein [Solirubrobacteraceae bacterium]|nr:glycosyl hydrolase family 79 C-terminal domain-containing protein [Solirubrobacteraceae bacterium]
MRRKVLVGALVASMLVLVPSAPAASTRTAAPAPPPPQAVVTVRPVTRGRPVPSGFVGLSVEYRALLSYLGTNPSAINPVFVRLLKNLSPGQAPVLRVGGDSTDWTWWPVPKMRQPPGITYDLTPTWLSVARSLALATGAHYILGINLEANIPKIETAETNALVSGIGRPHVTALELGNEPELYSKLGWYRQGSSYITGRPANYDFDGFTREFSSFRSAVSSVPVAGPSTGSFWWLTRLPQFLAAEPRLGMVTVHSYWLNRCLKTPALPGYPTVAHLLNPHPPSRLAGALARFAALAHGRGVPIRVDEMNSVTCGGEPGVSDVFASALWALNALFEAASDGVDGVNIHTFPGTANQLFSFTNAAGHWAAAVRPEYYGLLMFAQAVPPGSKLLTLVQQHTGQTRAWATVGRDGYTRIVLINDSLTQAGSALVRTSTVGEPATLERLLAPGASATTGITIDGQSFGTETQTGSLTGATSTLTLPAPTGPGPIASYAVSMPAASAALLTIPPRRRSPGRR